MKKLIKSNYSIFIFLSFFLSLVIVHIFYLAVINPLAFEYMAIAQSNNTSPERHFSVILKDPEQKICLTLFLWSIIIGSFNYFLLQDDYKTLNIVNINVQKLTTEMDSMIIATGTSTRHVKSASSSLVEYAKKQKFEIFGLEGENSGEWILIDFGDVVVNVMLAETRELYNLEKLWIKPKN